MKFIRTRKLKKTIKPNKNIIQFHRLLRSLGYRDRVPLQKDYELITWKILESLTKDKNINVSGTYIFYRTKKDFVYKFYLENMKTMRYKKLKKNIKAILKEIVFEEKSRMLELGWRVNVHHPLAILNLDHKTKVRIYIAALKEGKKHIKYGIPEDKLPSFVSNIKDINKPRTGDLIVSNPWGIGQDTSFMMMALNKRGNINKHVGFGPVKTSGFQYGRYDSDLNFLPI